MRLLESPRVDPAANLAVDAELFHHLERTGCGEALRFWETWEPAVVVGSLGAISREVHEDACRADAVPILRRLSGGGAVVVAQGCLNYSLVLSLDTRPELRHVGDSYRAILSRIIAALRLTGLTIQGQSDLAIGQRKISGNAQRRGRRALLHQGTLLYALNVRHMERYLKEPERQPEYRARRPHALFAANAPLQQSAIRAAVARAWNAQPDAEPAQVESGGS